MNKSPMNPDTNHLHQQVFYIFHKNNNLNKYHSNLMSANLINLYNLIVFIVSVNFFSNSQIQVLLILLNISIYTFIYFKLFILRYKKIMKKKIALIFGVTGQDGSYLSEFLIKKGYLVHGVKRRSSSFNTGRIDHIYQDPF